MRSGVADPSAGEMITVGPVHFDLRATTSASKERSANVTFGWDLSWRQASFVGIVSGSHSMETDGPQLQLGNSTQQLP